MPRPLRRQLDEYLSEEPESSARLRKLFRKIDREYRRADNDRALLQHALTLLSDLLQRSPAGEKSRDPSPRARAVSLLFDQAPFAALLCDADRKVTAWNAAAERLFDSFAVLPRHLLEKSYREGKFVQAWGMNTPPAEIAGLALQ